MKCVICGSECSEEKLRTFADYEFYLFSILCERTVEFFREKSEMSIEELELLRKCCETVGSLTYSHDLMLGRAKAAPKEKAAQND